MPQKQTTRRTIIKGPEPWTKTGGQEYCYWDLWFLTLVNAGGGWDSIIQELKNRRLRPGYERDDAEAKLNHIDDLRQRIKNGKTTPQKLLGDLADDKKLLKKSRTKVLEQTVGWRDKTSAMVDTPRRRLNEWAMRGNWDGFPVSPAKFEPTFLALIKKKGFYSKNASFGLSKRLGSCLNREAKKIKNSNAELLALYRAFLSAMIEAMHCTDDSFGVMGDLFQEELAVYLELPWLEIGVDPEIYYTDFLEFAVWEDYGLLDSNLDGWFAEIHESYVAQVESILLKMGEELAALEFDYQVEKVHELLSRLFVQKKQFDKFVDLAQKMGSRAWGPILSMAKAALKARRKELALDVFSAADQPGFHQDYLREECVELTGQLPPKKAHLTLVR